LEYAITKSDEGYSSYISTPLSQYEDYIIDHDINNIAEQDIINTEKSYTGAEIRYWFFINNITCFDPKYRYFWAYVDTYSNNRVSDKQKYFLYAAIRNGVYTHCRVVKDCSKNKKLTQKDIDDINVSFSGKIKDRVILIFEFLISISAVGLTDIMTREYKQICIQNLGSLFSTYGSLVCKVIIDIINNQTNVDPSIHLMILLHIYGHLFTFSDQK
jgi:hypothetical protein